MNARRSLLVVFVVGLALASGIAYLGADWWVGLPPAAQATYVGRESCVRCHQAEANKFHGSHHDLAMDLATPATVLGDFNNATLTSHGVESRMFRRDDRYWINTEGPDGKLADFEIKYVFGVEPLQQYMVEFDRPKNAAPDEIGRVQVLRVSWDTKRKAWFHLDPPDVKEKLSPDDDLHWTGIAQRWNTMCADCHSTNLQKNYDPATGHYRTTFSEIDVSCEACHGPGSLHEQLASTWSPFWDRERGYAIHSSHGQANVAEIETCAGCHARRRIVHPDYQPGKPWHDYFANELLHSGAYHADGENLDEVYEYGSFTQSKMFHKNIRCSDCHDPHTSQVKFADNRLCTSCHAHPAGKFDSVSHHHHEPGTPGASCVECHMPETHFMEVDGRRDHGLRVPRPDLSVKHGTPNACTQCHVTLSTATGDRQKFHYESYAKWLERIRLGDQELSAAVKQIDQYCAAALARWYPPQKRKEDAMVPALTGIRAGEASATTSVIRLAQDRGLSDILRATAMYELATVARPNNAAWQASLKGLRDASPQVRVAAIANLEALPPEELREQVAPLLTDSSRMVRAEAARVLARIERTTLRREEHDQFEDAFQEFLAGLKAANDRGASHIAAGVAHEQLGELDAAEQDYRTAMRVEPNMVGPRSHLAALLETRVDAARQQAEVAMRSRDQQSAVKAMEPVASHQVLIEKLRQEELTFYRRDARLAPRSGAIHYRWGLLAYLCHETEEALQALQQAAKLEPRQAEYRLTLALLLEKQGDISGARDAAEEAFRLLPDDEGIRGTLERLKQSR